MRKALPLVCPYCLFPGHISTKEFLPTGSQKTSDWQVCCSWCGARGPAKNNQVSAENAWKKVRPQGMPKDQYRSIDVCKKCKQLAPIVAYGLCKCCDSIERRRVANEKRRIKKSNK